MSRDLLWKRYHNFMQRVVSRGKLLLQLPQNETADALQELYFAFHDTVQWYDPENHCTKKLASFKTFLHLVIVRKFSNYCASWRTYNKHIALSLSDESLRHSDARIEENHAFSCNGINGINENGHSSMDWHKILQSELCSEDLAEALRKLKPKEKHLLKVWRQYGRDKLVAQVLGISIAAAKLRRERLFRRIRRSIISK